MNPIDHWSKLFAHSSFFALKKEEELSDVMKDHFSRLIYQKEVEGFHPNRKREFLLGRLCASVAHKMCTGSELLSLPRSENRQAEWPSKIIGSISHDQHWVGAAVAESEKILGVGIDFEVMGRTKLELASQIRSAEDLKTHPQFSDKELLTLIFSAKESLYKALNPTLKIFFGFEAAAVKEINFEAGTFVIDLIIDIKEGFGPAGRSRFLGRFNVDGESCLTVLEIPHF